MSLENYQRFTQAHQQMQQGNIAAARKLCNQILETNPTDADANNLLGIMASNQGDLQRAKDYFESGLSQHPKHIYLLNSFGSVSLQLGEFSQAEVCLEKAIQQKPDFTNAIYNLSRLKTTLQRYSDAELLLKQVIQLEPENADALANLSDIEEKQNNLTLATQYAEKALSINPRNLIARLTLSNVHFRNENYQAAIQELIPTLSPGQNLTPINYSLVVGGIAQAYDKMKQYPEAFDHYQKSNQALHYLYHQQFAEAESIYAPAQITQSTQSIKQFDFSQWQQPIVEEKKEETKLTPIFLLGFPRSGTTLLDQMLSAHSQLTTLEEKETLIDIYQQYPLSEENLGRLATMSVEEIEKFRALYWQRVSENSKYSGEGLLVDKLPLNSIMLIYIYRLFPDAKIIFSVRDPRDVVISCFQQRFGMNQAMYQFLDIDSTVSYYDDVMSLVKAYREKIQQQIYLLKYEQLILDYETVLTALFHFLGVEWEQDVANYRQQINTKLINTPSNKQVVKPLYTSAISKWKNYAAFLKGPLTNLNKWLAYWKYQ